MPRPDAHPDDQRPRVVITGVGAVSPIGVGAPAFTPRLRGGVSGVRALPVELRSERSRSNVAALCEGFEPASALDDADARRLPRMIPMALAAAAEALAHAGIAPSPKDAHSIGLLLGTGAGGIDFTLDQAHVGLRGERPSLWTITNATHGNLAGELSIRLGLRGPSLCLSTGCASSSDAAGLALELLRSANPSAPSVAVVVGADAHVRWETLLGMELLRVITTREWRDEDPDPRGRPASASRPFDRTRSGFVLGEGAWAVVLERESTARAREARPLGELLGYAATCDAFHRVRPDPDMTDSARALRLAIEDAALAPDDIDLLQCHGTSTPVNDEAETRAVHMAFGAHAQRLRCSSIKSMIGHPQGACGLASLVAMTGAMTNLDEHADGPFMPPTINLLEADPACDLDYTPNAPASLERGRRHTAVFNCLAFGAKNSALVMRA